MIEIKDTLVIKTDSPKIADWVKRMKAYKAAQLQDMVRRSSEVCEIATLQRLNHRQPFRAQAPLPELCGSYSGRSYIPVP